MWLGDCWCNGSCRGVCKGPGVVHDEAFHSLANATKNEPAVSVVEAEG